MALFSYIHHSFIFPIPNHYFGFFSKRKRIKQLLAIQSFILFSANSVQFLLQQVIFIFLNSGAVF